MSRRKITQKEIEQQHTDLAIFRAARETVSEQDRVFHEKRRENKNIFFILETIHPSFYDTFASKLSAEELENILKKLAGMKLYDEFWRNLSNLTIVRILSSIWEFYIFLEQVEAGTVNNFINSEANGWCLGNFCDFEFPEQLEMLSRFSEEGMESFFAEILENHIPYVSSISYIFQKMEAGKTEKTEMVFQKICELPAAILSELIRLGDEEMNGILMRKLSKEKVTAICCETEAERLYQVLEKSNFELVYNCQKPDIICQKLTDSELQALFLVLQKSNLPISSFSVISCCMEFFYHAVKPENKAELLNEILPAENFGELYQKLSKEEQDEMFELILTANNIREEKAQALRQEAMDFLEKKEKLSYFEKITLSDLQSKSQNS